MVEEGELEKRITKMLTLATFGMGDQSYLSKRASQILDDVRKEIFEELERMAKDGCYVPQLATILRKWFGDMYE